MDCACERVEALDWQGARRARTGWYVTDEERSQASWIGPRSVQDISERRQRRAQ